MLGLERGSLVAPAAALVMVAAACGSTPSTRADSGPAEPARSGQAMESLDPLERALEAYHGHGDVAPLRAWVGANPDHPDASLWREVVALREYEAAIGRAVDAVPSEEEVRLAAADLQAVALAYPGTLVARTAQAALGEVVLGQLRDAPLGPRMLDFLEGGTKWACDDDGRPLAPDLDLDRFRARHASTLLDGVGRRLHDGGCGQAVGWCAWWVDRFPDAAETPAIQTDLKEVWYRRAHPPWKGRRHLRCAHACARECRPRTTPLDDGCYTSCFAGC